MGNCNFCEQDGDGKQGNIDIANRPKDRDKLFHDEYVEELNYNDYQKKFRTSKWNS